MGSTQHVTDDHNSRPSVLELQKTLENNKKLNRKQNFGEKLDQPGCCAYQIDYIVNVVIHFGISSSLFWTQESCQFNLPSFTRNMHTYNLSENMLQTENMKLNFLKAKLQLKVDLTFL